MSKKNIMEYADHPIQVRVENTNHCNAKCVICPREKLSRPRGYMDMALFRSIVDQCVENDVKEMHLQGFGEPFLDKKIFDRTAYAKKKGIEDTLIVTNASFINEDTARRIIESGLDRIKISFYGTNAAEYESIHRGLSYDEVARNTKRFVQLKKELNSESPRISIKYIGHPLKFLKFTLQWSGYGRVSFSRLHNYGRGRKYNRPKKDKKVRYCPILLEDTMQVLWDGRVVPCCYDFDGYMIIGDLNHESILDIWKGERYRNFRKIHSEHRFRELPICYNCDKLK